MNIDLNNIADMCKKCIRKQIKTKGSWKIECNPIPKELEEKNYFPIEKLLTKEEYNKLTEEELVEIQLSNNKLLWAKEFLDWSIIHPKRNFEQYYQKEILLCTAKNRVGRLGRRLGKCVSEDTLILTSNRGLVPAKKILTTDLLISYDLKSKKIFPTKNFAITNNGYKECLKITTESGKYDIVTKNHPYLIKGKWKEASELKNGDKITIPINFSNIKYKNMADDNYSIYKTLGKIASEEQNVGSHIFRLNKNNTLFFLDGVLNRKIFTNDFFVQQLGYLLHKTGTKYRIKKINNNFEIEITGKYESNKDFINEKIISIENVGYKNTLSIAVANSHTFLTNGIITHNTEAMVIDILHFAFNNPNKKIIVAANSLNLITEIFNRMEFLLTGSKSAYKTSYTRKRSPSEKIVLVNGTQINGFTTGTDGSSIRGQSADRVYIDEAAYVTEQAYQVLMAFKLDNPNVVFVVFSTPTALETNFRKWCLVDPAWREFHYPSSILPNFEENDGPELRNSLTEEGYKLEVEAEFSEGDSKVFKTENIKNSLYQYKYCEFREELINPEKWKITIGVDYNEFKNGSQICVLGLYCGNPLDVEKTIKILNFTSIYKNSVDAKFKDLQITTIERIIELQKNFNADFVYCDEGHGSMQNEMLSKHFYEIGKIDIFKSINFASAYEFEDIHLQRKAHKRIKVMMVSFLQKRFEKEEIEISELEENGKGNLIEQLKEYRIERYDDKNQPIFRGVDHKIDALMLANFALIENFDTIFDKTTGNFIFGFKNEGYKISSGTFQDEEKKKPLGPIETYTINPNLSKKVEENIPKKRKILNKMLLKGFDNGFFD